MANKIVLVFLTCLVLGEISNIQARISPEKSVHVQRERSLCEATAEEVYHKHPITDVYETCFHNCVKHCPRENEQTFFECELRCDTRCSYKQRRRGAHDGSGAKVEEPKVEIPKTGPVTRVYTVCYDECSTECADDVECLKKCDKICTRVSQHKRSVRKMSTRS